MAERRQAVRREPIEVVIDDERVFEARPLPWMQANALGDEIVRQNVVNTNELVRLYVQDDIPQLEMKVARKISDWDSVLHLAYPHEDLLRFSKPRVLDQDEAAELVFAALEVNHLDHLRHLVDPNSPAPKLPGGNNSEAEGLTVIGQKTESILGSSSTDSLETPSSPSPEASS